MSPLNPISGPFLKKDDKTSPTKDTDFELHKEKPQTWLKADLPEKKEETTSGHLESHNFGGRKIHFEPRVQREVHHLAAMHAEERRDLFLAAKTRGAVHYESRPGVHMIVRHNHDGTYTLERGRH